MQNTNLFAKLHFDHQDLMQHTAAASSPPALDRANDLMATSPLLLPQVEPAALVKMGYTVLMHPVMHYVFSMRCPTTKTWWIVRKRYSDFNAIRKTMTRHYKASRTDRGQKKITAMLQPVMDFPFPKNYLRDDKDEIKKDRLHVLRSFSSVLMRVRITCMNLAARPPPTNGVWLSTLNTIYNQLTEFLQVPEPQFHQELHHVIATVSPHLTSSVKPSNGLSDNTDEEEAVCSICLDDFDCEHNVVELPCGHTFHKNCVGDWLKDHCTCPLCRTVSFDEEFMVEYVTQIILKKTKNDLLFKVNQARALFNLFRQGAEHPKAPRALPQRPRASSSGCRNLACTVCMELLTRNGPETLELECGHAFHLDCIYQWLGDHTTCPICRRMTHYGHLPQGVPATEINA
ncbi:unnamed protein product [Aphanomyces euteiches]